jgi:hypothetical protein
MTTPETLCTICGFDDMQISSEEMDCHVQSLLSIVSILVKPTSWDVKVATLLQKE